MPSKIRKSKLYGNFDDIKKKSTMEILSADSSKIHTHEYELEDIDQKYQTDTLEYMDEDEPMVPGVVSAKSVRVLGKGSKVNTEFNKQDHTFAEAPAQFRSKVGKKEYEEAGVGLDVLKKKFGFSWKQFARKFTIFAVIGGVILILGISAISTWAVDIWYNTPSVDSVGEQVQSSTIYARDGKTIIGKYYDEANRTVVPLADIPKSMQLAIIALEDKDFYYNESGIPWKNLAGSAFQCITSGNPNACRGGSGLSQQYIKNATGDQNRDVNRKVRELFTAIKLNQEKNKSDIIGLYLNQVPFGRNAYGIQEAAQTYFGVDSKDLTPDQSCWLAPLPNKPGDYGSNVLKPDSNNYKDLEYKKNVCLENLRNLKLEGTDVEQYIKTDQELKILKEKPPNFKEKVVNTLAPHFKDYIVQELKKFNISDKDLYTKGYKIVTTLDLGIQQKTEEGIAETRKRSVIDNGANNAAAMVLDGVSGEILSMVGSVDYNDVEIDGQVNVATATRQPGSSFKPYVYAAAFSQGFNPETLVFNAKQNYGTKATPYIPQNFGDANYSYAPITIRSGFQNSYNTVAVRSAYLAAGDGKDTTEVQKKGLENVFDLATKAGVKFPCVREECEQVQTSKTALDSGRCGIGSSIGACELTMVSHVTGINTLAHEGNLRTATPFISILKPDPKNTLNKIDIFKNAQEGNDPVYPKKDRIIDAGVAKQVMNVMSDYKARYPAFCGPANLQSGCPLAANLELAGWDGANAVAAKTGTTDDAKDTWAVGASPYYTVATWVGNTDGRALNSDAAAASAAAPVWNRIMNKIHNEQIGDRPPLEKRGFNLDGLIKTQLSTQSGLIVETGGNAAYLTDFQIKALQDAQKRLNDPAYNPADGGIFNNRTVVVGRNIRINKVDGKIAVDGKTIPGNIEQKYYLQSVPEFPSQPWIGIAQNYGARFGLAPNDFSNQDQIADQNSKPTLSTNVAANTNAPGTIILKAEAAGDKTKKITKTEILVDGVVVASGESSAEYSTNGKDGTHTIVLRSTDSQNVTAEAIILGVVFGKPVQSNQVTINNPSTTSLSSSSIILSISTSDSSQSIKGRVRISQANGSAECILAGLGTSYSCSINPNTLTPGPATITFADESGNGISASGKSVVLN
jgi:membrane peptidoglycan carboxypeptidase